MHGLGNIIAPDLWQILVCNQWAVFLGKPHHGLCMSSGTHGPLSAAFVVVKTCIAKLQFPYLVMPDSK